MTYEIREVTVVEGWSATGIVWENGVVEKVASIGFDEMSSDFTDMLKEVAEIHELLEIARAE